MMRLSCYRAIDLHCLQRDNQRRRKTGTVYVHNVTHSGSETNGLLPGANSLAHQFMADSL